MQATIAKRFTFHAAHRLPNHDGPCRNLHGHSYQLEVAVTGPVKAANGDPDEGMVLDFSVIKDVYREQIEPYVEHQNLNDTLADEVPRTTCEFIAGWIHRVFKRALPTGMVTAEGEWRYEVCVRLWETPTSYATIGKAPWRE